MTLRLASVAITLLVVHGCAASAPPASGAGGVPTRIAAPEGFQGPEAVRYDPDRDLYFVSNWNGPGGEMDNNGFISTLGPDGAIRELRFIQGGAAGVTLHAPRGMAFAGDTLWVADVDAVRAFHRRTGAPLAEVGFAGQDVGFLNDVAVGPDGSLYVTDTGRDRIYRVRGGAASVALADSALGRPNGITWDARRERFIVVPFGGSGTLLGWRPGSTALEPIGSSAGSRFDGVEVLPDGRVLVASQADTALHIFENGVGRPVARTAGRPADIGVDTRRMRVAVPFIALNQVEIWQLPAR